MFGRKKKKTSFEPDIGQPPDEPELYTEHQHEHDSRSHQQMGRSNVQQIINNLASSPNDFASGIALCIKALAEATASPPASPIMIEYRGRRMAFGRRNLERMDGHEAIRMAVRTIYPQGHISDSQRFIAEASLFTEDGRPDRRVVGIDLDSWVELLPYINSLFLRVDAPPTSPRDRDRDRDRDRYRDRDRERERERPLPGVERRDEPTQPAEPSGSGLERSQSQNEGYPSPE